MSTPSLLNIPYVIKAGTLYSQIPETGAGDFTVTRATSPANNRSTRINANGFIELVNDNVPRLDYPRGGAVNGCPALLVEPAATNLVPNGLSYNAVTGVLYDTTVTDSPATGINSARATKNEGAGNNRYPSQIFSAIALSANTAYTVSRFFKFDGHTFATSLEASSSAQWGNVTWNQVINLASTGVTLGTSTNCTGSVENYGNGWFRVSVRVTTGATISGATTVNVLSILPSALSTGQGFLASLPQLETGSVPTSYIHTTTQAIARATDVVNKGGIGGLIGQTEGTIYWEGESLASGAQDIISINQSNTNSVYITKITTNVYRCVVIASGTPEVIVDDTVVKTGFVKIAFAYKSGNTALFINGAQVGLTNTTVFTFSGALSSLIFGPGAYYSGRPDQKCRTVALYPNRLSNGDLQTLTA
jgi:hypothetical protein